MWQMLIARSCHRSQAKVNPYKQVKPLMVLFYCSSNSTANQKSLEGRYERAPRPGIIISPKASNSACGMSYPLSWVWVGKMKT